MESTLKVFCCLTKWIILIFATQLSFRKWTHQSKILCLFIILKWHKSNSKLITQFWNDSTLSDLTLCVCSELTLKLLDYQRTQLWNDSSLKWLDSEMTRLEWNDSSLVKWLNSELIRLFKVTQLCNNITLDWIEFEMTRLWIYSTLIV